MNIVLTNCSFIEQPYDKNGLLPVRKQTVRKDSVALRTWPKRAA